ncbi:DUF3938 domain-containing protein [Bacillus rhizoplanae]|uniref:DUF3938 domain-containing protein n=1 Tax=Bacillus rhizoplanae TaxID=2880966 RepID=UPI003D20991A
MNKRIRFIIATLFAVAGGLVCFWTNTHTGENIYMNGIDSIVSASILGSFTFFLFNPEENARKTTLLTMIGIVGGCISFSTTTYNLPLQLSTAFFHGLWTWFIAFCLADIFDLLQDESHVQMESNS